MNDDDAPLAPGDVPPTLNEAHRRGLVLLEIRRARLKLAERENELMWAAGALSAGYISVDAAIQILNETMDEEEDDVLLRQLGELK